MVSWYSVVLAFDLSAMLGGWLVGIDLGWFRLVGSLSCLDLVRLGGGEV